MICAEPKRLMRRAALLGIALLACAEKRQAGPHAPAPRPAERESREEPGPLERKITVCYLEVRLPEALDDLKERAGLRSAYVRLVDRGFTCNFVAEGVTVREVLEKLAAAGDLAFDCHGDIAVFWREGDEELRRELSMKTVTFEFGRTPLKEALEFIQAASGVEIVLDARIEKDRRVTLQSYKMSPHLALLWIVKLCDLEYDVHNRRVYVTRPDLLDSLPITAQREGTPESATPERSSDQDKAALERLERGLANVDPRVRAEALWNMERVGGERMVNLLERALTDEDREVRAAAASGLGYIRGERAAAALEKAVLDADGLVQQCALRALALTGGAKALGPLERALESPASSVRLSAVAALEMQCSAKALTLLLRALEMEVYEDDPTRLENLRWMRERRVSLDFVDRPLDEAVSSFQTMTKANVILDPKCGGDISKRVTVKAKEVSFEEALNLLLEDTGLVWGVNEYAVIISTPQRLAEWGDEYNSIRETAFWELRRFRGIAVRDALIARAAAEPYEELRKEVVRFLRTSFSGDPEVEKALAEPGEGP